MRLSAIRLAGFKSFVDRTQLDLSSNLTAVVGPNGCGKSNLIDAVRWVLGESSAKQLRGSALADVIFNGSKSRKPVGRAMIELVFDNSDASVTGAYAQFGEIAVRRELSRDGGSQFSINGTRCRRKDITELFLGTGLGSRSNYAIIEQGTVSRLIEAQPEELRQMLEESAGISRYKEKRRETEIRIKHTRENMERLSDLLSEIDERLAKLQRQAKAAQRFKQYKDQQRGLRRQLLGLRWRELERQHSILREQMGSLEAARDAALAGLQQATQQRSAGSEAAEQAVQRTQDSQAEYYAAEAELARVRQELKHAQDMTQLREQELRELRAEWQRLDAQHSERARRGEEIAQQIETLAPVISATQQEFDELDAGFASAEELAQQSGQALEDIRRALNNPRTAAATEQVRLEQLQRQAQRHAQQLQQCEQALAQIDLGNLQSEQVQAKAAAEQTEKARLSAEQAASDGSQQVEQARAARASADRALHEARQAAQAIHARHAALQAEQDRALNEDDAAAQQWLAAQGWDAAPVLARQLKVDARWAAAVEAVLGPWLQAPCITGALPVGGADAVPLETLIAQDAGAWDAPPGTLAAELQGPVAARMLLASIWVEADEAAAMKRLASLPAGHGVATPNGSIRWQGARRWLHSDPDDGVLQREQRLRELKQEDAAARETLTASSEAQAAAEQALRQAEQAQQQSLKELDVARRQHAEAGASAQRLNERYDAQSQRSAQLQREQKELLQLQTELKKDEQAAGEKLAQARQDSSELEQREKRARDAADQARAGLQMRRQRRQELQRLREQQRERRAQLATELAACQAARDALATRVAQLKTGLESSQAQQQTTDQPLGALQTAVDAAQQRQSAAQSALAQVRAAQEAAQLAARRGGQAVLDAETALQQARENLQQSQFAEQRLLAQRDALNDQFRQANAVIDEVVAGLDPDTDASAAEQELLRLDERITRLGAVNLAAVEEYDEEKLRADHLRAQEADLTEALEKLEDAIRQIDRETRSRFRATFDAVDEKFRARFPKLFGGGEAYLELTGDDVLDAGVKVMARPPGKRNSSIALLSGGEKALTAVALVFALFELNPAPFCMLDEVDAPLDDANVVRYCEVVREMSDRVQFIIVTHNKITMELADQLNGVTMQEAGVSRLVSVDVQQAVALAG